jgi:hypothetical protein
MNSKRSKILLIVLLVTLSMTSGQEPIAFYPFNGNANDESGNGNDGFNYGATLVEDRFGIEGSAFTFDNPISSDINRIHMVGASGFLGGQAFETLTISSWFKAGIQNDDCSYITRFASSDGTFYLGYESSGNASFNLRKIEGGTLNQVLYAPAESDSWNHLVGTWDGTTQRIYLNGNLVDEAEFNWPLSTASTGNTIGANYNGLSSPCSFDGTIDDVRIYNRALNVHEVDSLYHSDGWDPSIVAYYPLNGNTNDESGNGHNGTGYDLISIPDRFGHAEGAYSFNGNSSRIQIGLASEIIPENSRLTLSAWVRPNSYDNPSKVFIGCENADQGLAMYYYPYNGHQLNILTGSRISVDANLTPIGQWNHIVSTYDESDSLRVYINGSIVATSYQSSWSHAPGADLFIGADENGTPTGGGFFDGDIDDVSIYSRALSGIEIDSLYHQGGWDTEIGIPLIAYYRFNGNTFDESGNSNDGELMGGATVNSTLHIGNNDLDAFWVPGSIVNGLGDFSITAMVKLDQNNPSHHLISVASSDQTNVMTLQYHEGDNNWNVVLNGTYNSFISDNRMEDMQFHHLVLLRIENIFRLYLDGVEIGDGIVVSNELLHADHEGVIIGQDQDNVGGGFNSLQAWAGQIDNLRLFNKGLNSEEIDSIYIMDRLEISLIAFYPFNGNANDESGNDNHGINNGAMIAQDRFGYENSAYSFSGIDQWIDLPNSSGNLTLGPNDNFSTSVWFKPTGDQDGFIFGNSGANNGDFRVALRRINNSSVELYVGRHGYFNDVITISSVENDLWHQLALVSNGNSIRSYHNGNYVADLVIENALGSNPNNFGFLTGRYFQAPYYHYSGEIDEVRIYSSVLSDEDIYQLYREGLISMEPGSLGAVVGESIVVPINVIFPPDELYRSAELNFSGYMGGLQFTGIETAGTMLEGLGWSIQHNENESMLLTAYAGTHDISGSGVFCYLMFDVVGEICTTIPINLEYAKFNSNEWVETTNGSVTIVPNPQYGDADHNGTIEALDASDVLLHVLDDSYLDCQGIANADVYLDGLVDAMDASIILMYIVEYFDELPVTPTTTFLASGDLDAEDQEAIPNSIVSIPFNISGGENIYAFEGSISYDPTKVTPAEDPIEWSQLLDGFFISTVVEGDMIHFVGAGANPDGAEGVFLTSNFILNEDVEIGEETTITLNGMKFNSNLVLEDVGAIIASVVSIDPIAIPDHFVLQQNYPNPFNPSTTIRYGLPDDANVSLMIYDIRGQVIQTIESGYQPAGWYNVNWSGETAEGKTISTGIYFARLVAGKYSEVIKMLYLK